MNEPIPDYVGTICEWSPSLVYTRYGVTSKNSRWGQELIAMRESRKPSQQDLFEELPQ
jgi:hypothetical protein